MRNYAHLLDDYEDNDQPRYRKPRKKAAKAPVALADPEVGYQHEFRPTFPPDPTKHEYQWVVDYLKDFYNDQLIADVLHRVKGGKEANVYCCEAHPVTGVDLLAAKIYRPREFRSLRNDAVYRQGRRVLGGDGKRVKSDRELHAVAKGSSYGKRVAHTSWLAHEYETLQALYAAGADVPKPWAVGSNAILMEYLGEAGVAAPTLQETRLAQHEARPLLDRVIHNLDLMLQQGRVHGDLSAFNILYWESDIHLIDFPQVVDIRTNHEAWDIFYRDVERVCQYFDRYGVAPNAHRLATKLWRRYVPEDDFEKHNLLALAETMDEGED